MHQGQRGESGAAWTSLPQRAREGEFLGLTTQPVEVEPSRAFCSSRLILGRSATYSASVLHFRSHERQATSFLFNRRHRRSPSGCFDSSHRHVAMCPVSGFGQEPTQLQDLDSVAELLVDTPPLIIDDLLLSLAVRLLLGLPLLRLRIGLVDAAPDHVRSRSREGFLNGELDDITLDARDGEGVAD